MNRARARQGRGVWDPNGPPRRIAAVSDTPDVRVDVSVECRRGSGVNERLLVGDVVPVFAGVLVCLLVRVVVVDETPFAVLFKEHGNTNFQNGLSAKNIWEVLGVGS